MYRLLIVDDEPGIVEGLYQLFKQNKSFELDMCKAYSGVEALKYLKSTRFDIVMTDICMPGLDGMQLLDEIALNWPSCKVIFLTGYSEFEYVYRAIKKTDVSYILKTEEDVVIFEAVRNAIKKIQDETEVKDIIGKANRQLKQALPMLRREFLTGILQGDSLSDEDRACSFNELEISLDSNQPVLVVAAKVSKWNYKNTYSEKIQKFYVIQDIFESYLKIMVSSISVYTDDSMVVWFVQPNSVSGDGGGCCDTGYASMKTFVKGNIELIQDSIKNVLHVSTNFALADEEVRWEDAYSKFGILKALINNSLMRDQHMLIIDEGLEKSSFRQKEEYYLRDRINIEREMVLLSILLVKGLEDEFHKAFNRIVEMVKRSYGSGSLVGMEFYHAISSLFISYINKMDLDGFIFKDGNINVLMGSVQEKTWEEVADCFRRLSSMIFEVRRMKETDGMSKVIERIHKYINENIDKDISMARLSEVVHFNPSYLSRFYKQVTGGTISDYINERKLKTACDLLSDKRLKINEVAERVGFESPSYFSSFFKRMMKQSPQEYRDSL